ncbi:MAG: CPBP family intramembrane metalloprotease [Chthonomonas sp.]|nr:CPBP family intramembrane metalloprotease [Chthonomonas sp.]
MNEPAATPPIIDPAQSTAILWRWALVLSFFLLVIAMTFDARARRTAKAEEGVSSTDLLPVQLALQMESLARFSESNGSPEGAASYRSSSTQALTESLESASKQRTKSFQNAAFYAAIATSLKQTIPNDVIQKLSKEQSPQGKAVLELYTSPKLSEKRSRELANQVTKVNGIGSILAYQALEKGGDKHAIEQAYPKEKFLILFGLGMIMVAGLVGGVAAWIYYFNNRDHEAWKVLDHPFSFATNSQASTLGVLAAGLFGLFMVNSEMFASAFEGQPEHIIVFGSSFIFMLMLLGIISVLRLGGRTLYAGLNQSPFSLGKQVFLGLAGWAANLPVIVVLIGLLSNWIKNSNADHPINEMLSAGGGPAAAFALLFAGAVVAPVWEEIAFRGALFGGLRVALSRFKFGLPLAIFLTSFAFAAIHPQGPALWLMLGWLSVTGCFLTYRTRSIVPAIVMHAVHNGMLFLMSMTLMS